MAQLVMERERNQMIGNLVGQGINVAGNLLTAYIASRNPTPVVAMSDLFDTPARFGARSPFPPRSSSNFELGRPAGPSIAIAFLSSFLQDDDDE